MLFFSHSRVQILKKEYKCGQYCTLLRQLRYRYFFVLAITGYVNYFEYERLCIKGNLEVTFFSCVFYMLRQRFLKIWNFIFRAFSRCLYYWLWAEKCELGSMRYTTCLNPKFLVVADSNKVRQIYHFFVPNVKYRFY